MIKFKNDNKLGTTLREIVGKAKNKSAVSAMDILNINGTESSDPNRIIRGLKPKCSFGHDGSKAKFIRIIKDEICFPLSLIFNKSLLTETFPDMMKLG